MMGVKAARSGATEEFVNSAEAPDFGGEDREAGRSTMFRGRACGGGGGGGGSERGGGGTESRGRCNNESVDDDVSSAKLGRERCV